MTYKKGDYIAVITNQPEMHFRWIVDSILSGEEIEPEEYTAKIKSVIGNHEAYLVFIPSIGFRCVVNASEVLRRVSEDEMTDEERMCEDDIRYMAPNVFESKEDYEGVNNEGRCLLLALDAMAELFPDDKVVSVETCHSDYIKSDLLNLIDRLIQKGCNNSKEILEKREYFREMLEHLRFKEYYNVRVGVEDVENEAEFEQSTNYVYVAVDCRFNEVSIKKDFYSDGERFDNSLGPEYDSIYRFFTEFRSEIQEWLNNDRTGPVSRKQR